MERDDICNKIKTEIDKAIGQSQDVIIEHLEKVLDMSITEVIEKGVYNQVLLKSTFYELERLTDDAIEVMLDKSIEWVRANAGRFCKRPSSMEVYMDIEIGEAECEKANQMMMDAIKKMANKPMVEIPLMEINEGLDREERRLLATYCHRLIRQMGATTIWNESQFNVAICLLRMEYAICKKDNVWDLFVNSLMSFINRLNTSNYKQQAKDISSSAIAIGYREHKEEHAYVIGCGNYTDGANYVMALYYMLIAMAYLDKKGGTVTHRLAIDIIWELLKIIRETRKYNHEDVDLLVHTFDDLHATDFETMSIHHTAMSTKLYVGDKSVIEDALDFFETYDKQLKEYEENMALPLFTFLKGMHEFFSDDELKELASYEKQWADKVKRKGNELYVDFYDYEKSLYDHLKVLMEKMSDIRNIKDYAHDCKTAQFVAIKVLDEAAKEQSTEKFLLAMTLRSDYTFLMGNRYSAGMAPIKIKDVNPADVKTDYGDTEHLKEWMHVADTDMVIWLGRGKKSYYKMTLYHNMYNIDAIERWNRVIFQELRTKVVSNLKYQDYTTTRDRDRIYKSSVDWEEEEVELKKRLFDSRFAIPEFPERLLFVKDIEIGSYPHQLFVEEGEELFVGEMRPSANVFSTEYLTECCKEEFLPIDYTKSYWSPDSTSELTFGGIMDRIGDVLREYGFNVSMGETPEAPLSSDLNIVCAHGGKNISEDECFFVGGEPIIETDRIVGSGKLLILLVCHSGSITHKEYEHVMHTMIKRYIRMGYKSVIAPMWSLATDIIPLWLPVLMERMAAGNYVIDATYEANMAVKRTLYTPEAWACLHLFGNPYVRVGQKNGDS